MKYFTYIGVYVRNNTNKQTKQMMKQLILLLLFLMVGVSAQAQYRAFTVEGFAGKGLDTNTEFYGGSANLQWGFNESWYLLNWNGISYDVERPLQRWLSSEITLNRGFGKSKTFGIGGGVQYRNSMVDSIDGFYAIIKIRKTVKL